MHMCRTVSTLPVVLLLHNAFSDVDQVECTMASGVQLPLSHDMLLPAAASDIEITFGPTCGCLSGVPDCRPCVPS